MATYIHRDENGMAKSKMTGDIANKIFRTVKGKFRNAHFKDGNKTVFEITDDTIMSVDGGYFTLFLWAGDILIPDS